MSDKDQDYGEHTEDRKDLLFTCPFRNSRENRDLDEVSKLYRSDRSPEVKAFIAE